METYTVYVEREDESRSIAYTFSKEGEIFLDSSDTSTDELNPAESLLSSLGGCILKNISKIVVKRMHINVFEAHIEITGLRSENPPKIKEVKYKLYLLTDRSVNIPRLMELLVKYGTVYNTLQEAVNIDGEIINETETRRSKSK
ncbi:MAG TPA: OsmC family peroxiredoxin [candidate division WOR-3 bacterium]|uniref:OsmC family peroxiredoxin n=1 Tax=candidate division WOR-3 bacterium TaxID=2052148 RepID=A0A7C5HNI0_UNCW3|nr:OsmC family peroxiredoxin [candidate division WOR-3 bacterium]